MHCTAATRVHATKMSAAQNKHWSWSSLSTNQTSPKRPGSIWINGYHGYNSTNYVPFMCIFTVKVGKSWETEKDEVELKKKHTTCHDNWSDWMTFKHFHFCDPGHYLLDTSAAPPHAGMFCSGSLFDVGFSLLGGGVEGSVAGATENVAMCNEVEYNAMQSTVTLLLGPAAASQIIRTFPSHTFV